MAALVPLTALGQESSAGASKLNPYSSADVEKLVRIYFADIPPMIAAAKCESGYRQFNASGGVLYGGAGQAMIGVYQINKIHLPEAAGLGMDILSMEGNLSYARRLHDERGMDPWMSSYNCWSSAQSEVTGAGAAILSAVNGLSYGAVSSEVLKLQKMLNAAGFTIAESGPGSSGNETTKFGDLTRAAVRKFQCAKDIICSGSEATTGYGLVGEKTYSSLAAAAKAGTTQASVNQPSDRLASNQSAAVAQSNTASDDKAAEVAKVTAQIASLTAELSSLNDRLTELTR
jgi:hypothetical protein